MSLQDASRSGNRGSKLLSIVNKLTPTQASVSLDLLENNISQSSLANGSSYPSNGTIVSDDDEIICCDDDDVNIVSEPVSKKTSRQQNGLSTTATIYNNIIALDDDNSPSGTPDVHDSIVVAEDDDITVVIPKSSEEVSSKRTRTRPKQTEEPPAVSILQEPPQTNGIPDMVACTACGKKVSVVKKPQYICKHSKLGVLMCKKCQKFVNTSKFSRDEMGIEEYCTWCGDGGKLVCCDFCEKAYCKNCVKRNLGKDFLKVLLNADENMKWKCFCCDLSQLKAFQEECDLTIEHVNKSRMNETAFEAQKVHLGGPSQIERLQRLSEMSQLVNASPSKPQKMQSSFPATSSALPCVKVDKIRTQPQATSPVQTTTSRPAAVDSRTQPAYRKSTPNVGQPQVVIQPTSSRPKVAHVTTGIPQHIPRSGFSIVLPKINQSQFPVPVSNRSVNQLPVPAQSNSQLKNSPNLCPASSFSGQQPPSLKSRTNAAFGIASKMFPKDGPVVPVSCSHTQMTAGLSSSNQHQNVIKIEPPSMKLSAPASPDVTASKKQKLLVVSSSDDSDTEIVIVTKSGKRKVLDRNLLKAAQAILDAKEAKLNDTLEVDSRLAPAVNDESKLVPVVNGDGKLVKDGNGLASEDEPLSAQFVEKPSEKLTEVPEKSPEKTTPSKHGLSSFMRLSFSTEKPQEKDSPVVSSESDEQAALPEECEPIVNPSDDDSRLGMIVDDGEKPGPSGIRKQNKNQKRKAEMHPATDSSNSSDGNESSQGRTRTSRNRTAKKQKTSHDTKAKSLLTHGNELSDSERTGVEYASDCDKMTEDVSDTEKDSKQEADSDKLAADSAEMRVSDSDKHETGGDKQLNDSNRTTNLIMESSETEGIANDDADTENSDTENFDDEQNESPKNDEENTDMGTDNANALVVTVTEPVLEQVAVLVQEETVDIDETNMENTHSDNNTVDCVCADELEIDADEKSATEDSEMLDLVEEVTPNLVDISFHIDDETSNVDVVDAVGPLEEANENVSDSEISFLKDIGPALVEVDNEDDDDVNSVDEDPTIVDRENDLVVNEVDDDSAHGSDGDDEQMSVEPKNSEKTSSRRKSKTPVKNTNDINDSDDEDDSLSEAENKSRKKPNASSSEPSDDDGNEQELKSSKTKGKSRKNKNKNSERDDSTSDAKSRRKSKRKKKSADDDGSGSEDDAENPKKRRSSRKKKTSNDDDSEASDSSVEERVVKKKSSRLKQRQRRRKKESDHSDEDVSEASEEESSSSEEMSEDGTKRAKIRKSKRSKRGKARARKKDTKRATPKKKRRDKKKVVIDDSDATEGSEDEECTPSKSNRRNIRKIIKDKDLTEETKRARALEEQRRKRLLERTKAEEAIGADVVLDEEEGDFVLERNKDKEVLVSVDAGINKHLKPHQRKGVQFVYDCVIESIKAYKKGDQGGGALLAHCMGLGKTLQVIAFIHTMMNNENIGMKTILVVAPLNTVLNWEQEFEKWLDHDQRMDVYCLSYAANMKERVEMLVDWTKSGGVLITGYEMYRNLVNHNFVKSKKLKLEITRCLADPGPQLVICDEGHILRNSSSAISKSLNVITTKRRIVLTGTPLQNNLAEYHVMVDFIKPKLLGTLKEFQNRFINPIKNGQCSDSGTRDVRVMKYRCHVLYELLSGCVQRQDYSVLTPFLPPKREYTIQVRLSEKQKLMYQYYLDTFTQMVDGKVVGVSLFSDFHCLSRIWSHPWGLQLEKMKRAQRERNKREFDDFIDDEESPDEESEENEEEEAKKKNKEPWDADTDSSDDDKKKRKRRKKMQDSDDSDNSDSDDDDNGEEQVAKKKKSELQTGKRNTRNSLQTVGELDELPSMIGSRSLRNQQDDEEPGDSNDETVTVQPSPEKTRGNTRSGRSFKDGELNPAEDDLFELGNLDKEWYDEFLTQEDETDMEMSGKLVLLLEILADAEVVGDKLLVFSQSLISLDLIEKFLGGGEIGGNVNNWCHGVDYFRMDGSTPVHKRKRWADIFNDKDIPRCRLFLISTKAGSLGINMCGANRVIVFDCSWNPSHDVQSVFRVYRFGQEKPCYIYRFIAQGTMEEKVYGRQITKLSVAGRVVDEQQIERHFTNEEIRELYTFAPDEWKEGEERETPALPKDPLLAEVLQRQHPKWIVRYHEHDLLLENIEEEEMTEEEKKQAWESYNTEKDFAAKGIQIGTSASGRSTSYQDQMAMQQLQAIQMQQQMDAYRNFHPPTTTATYRFQTAGGQIQVPVSASGAMNTPVRLHLKLPPHIPANDQVLVNEFIRQRQDEIMRHLQIEQESRSRQLANFAAMYSNSHGHFSAPHGGHMMNRPSHGPTSVVDLTTPRTKER